MNLSLRGPTEEGAVLGCCNREVVRSVGAVMSTCMLHCIKAVGRVKPISRGGIGGSFVQKVFRRVGGRTSSDTGTRISRLG